MTSTEKMPDTTERKTETSDIQATVALAAASPTQADSAASASASLDALVTVVLDSAGVANRSASIAASSTESLLTAVGYLGKVTERARMGAAIVLGAAALSIVAAAGALFAVSVQLGSRLTQTNATLLAVGKRAVQMNTGIENLGRIETVLAEVAKKPETDRLQKLEEKLDAALSETRRPIGAAPMEKPAKQDDARHQALLTQMKALEAQTQTQARAITRMTEQIAASRADLSKTMSIARGVETTLASFGEKQRLAGAAPNPPAPREREKPAELRLKEFIHYPAAQADKGERQRQTPASADAAALIR